jgi:antibiotic biosynthesis monooxygenase (ABM) superfamily enzyme
MTDRLAQETGHLTVVVTWRVRQGSEREFESWRREISTAALAFPGHMGVNVILPSDTGREYVVIFRFDTYEHLRAWQESDIRRELLKKAEPFREHEPSYVLRATGLSDDEANSSIRFSFGRFTSENDIEDTVIKINETLSELNEDQF